MNDIGSYVQVTVGGMLLVTAFLFGRYINGKSVVPGKPLVASKADLTDTQPEVETSQKRSDSNSLQRTLRERILGKRAQNEKNSEKQLKRKLVSASDESTVMDQKIVEPDFSHLEIDETVFRQPPPRQSTVEGKFVRGRLPKPPKDRFSDEVLAAHQQTKYDRVKTTDRSSESKPRVLHQPISNRMNLIPVRERRIESTTASEKFLRYKTVFGDTLHSLSTKFYGRSDFYLEIYLANKDLFDSPSNVPMSTNIRIPVNEYIIDEFTSKNSPTK